MKLRGMPQTLDIPIICRKVVQEDDAMGHWIQISVNPSNYQISL